MDLSLDAQIPLKQWIEMRSHVWCITGHWVLPLNKCTVMCAFIRLILYMQFFCFGCFFINYSMNKHIHTLQSPVRFVLLLFSWRENGYPLHGMNIFLIILQIIVLFCIYCECKVDVPHTVLMFTNFASHLHLIFHLMKWQNIINHLVAQETKATARKTVE